MKGSSISWLSIGARGALACALVCLLGTAGPARATLPVATRPIADFLAAQGTTNIFIPPVPDFIGWADNPANQFASVDYAGLAAGWLTANGGPDLETQSDGTVVERPLSDGRAMVYVILRTTRANSWVVGLPGDLALDPLQFGYRAQDLLADPSLKPALSSCVLSVTFKNTAPGAPLPDLVDAFILGNTAQGQELRTLAFRSDGEGPLHAIFGVPEGTPGHLTVTQTGLLTTGFHGATGDAFPAERVDLHPLEP